MGSPKISYPGPDASEVALRNEQVAMLQEQNRLLQEQASRTQMLEPLFWEASGITPQYDEAGNITGFAKGEKSDTDKAIEEANALLAERSVQALKGELPVNPAWTTQKSDTIARFEENLRRQGLKAGDTPYDTAMSQLSTQLEGTEYGLRSGDIGLYEGLSMARGYDQDRRTQQLLSQYSMLPAAYNASGQSFGQAAMGYNAPLSMYQQDRMGQMQAQVYNAQMPSFGRNFTNSLGTSFGTSLGSAWTKLIPSMSKTIY